MQEYKKFTMNKEDVLPTAERMKAEGRALVMIHGYLNKENQPVISYDYAIENVIESYDVIDEKSFPTISPIYSTAAEWAERELNELLGIEFEGLDTSKRLFLPENLLDDRGQIVVTPLSELREKYVLE